MIQSREPILSKEITTFVTQLCCSSGQYNVFRVGVSQASGISSSITESDRFRDNRLNRSTSQEKQNKQNKN